MNYEVNKKELEKLIAKEWTIGNYFFDEDRQCFFGDAEISLFLRETGSDIYQSCGYYYFDGYECGVDKEDIENIFFNGEKEKIRSQIIEEFNSENSFMGYPIIYTDISIGFEMCGGEFVNFSSEGEISIEFSEKRNSQVKKLTLVI